MIGSTRWYWITCDQDGCMEQQEWEYGRDEAEEANGRPTRWARQQASRAGWSAFSDRDLCPEHSHKRH